MDFIFNGQGHGSVAAQLLQNGLDVGCLRPWSDRRGNSFITVNDGFDGNGELKFKNIPIGNATATLPKDAWLLLDQQVMRAARPRLKLVADLRSSGLEFNVPNGMGKTVLQSQTMSDVGDAQIDMDAAVQTRQHRQDYGLANLPLPIIHKDFHFTLREIAVSRQSGTPLDTTNAEISARKVGEEAEKLAIGTKTFRYGGGNVYGLTNFPQRITKSITPPTDPGWTPAIAVTEIMEMKQLSMQKHYHGPWRLYASQGWDLFLDRDYSDVKGSNTLRQRILQTDGINSIQTLDYLNGYQLILVQMTSDTIREVIGMEITTLQWESMGGLKVHFKVMAIMVPQLRADYNGSTGIVHGA